MREGERERKGEWDIKIKKEKERKKQRQRQRERKRKSWTRARHGYPNLLSIISVFLNYTKVMFPQVFCVNIPSIISSVGNHQRIFSFEIPRSNKVESSDFRWSWERKIRNNSKSFGLCHSGRSLRTNFGSRGKSKSERLTIQTTCTGWGSSFWRLI